MASAVSTPKLDFTIEDTVRRAESLCRSLYGTTARLHLQAPIVADKGYRNMVLRCEAHHAGAPPTLILKRSNLGGGHVFTEWAALAFLNTIEELRGLVPALIAGDREHEMLILEDLGDTQDRRLRDVLAGSDRHAAEAAMIETSVQVGRLQAACTPRIRHYEEIRDALPAAAPIDFHQIGHLEASLRGWPQALARLGLPATHAFEAELAEVGGEIRNPGGFLTLVHGDWCPSNFALVAGGVRMFDFEVSRCGHALLDGAYPRVRHLNCLDGHRIPRPLQRRMEAAYRGALAHTCGAAADDRVFARGMTAACAAWTAVLISSLEKVVDADRPRGPVSYRQRIVCSLEELATTAAELGAFPAIGAVASQMYDRLAGDWRDDLGPIRSFRALA